MKTRAVTRVSTGFSNQLVNRESKDERLSLPYYLGMNI